jgi:Tol biopolymer transport system component/C-terminal processing protease CtpA/Prc
MSHIFRPHYFLLWLLLLSGFTNFSPAQEAEVTDPIRLATMPALSPDGSQLSFAWAGDIWIASSDGGDARRITTHPAVDGFPLFSPDGETLAFTSERTGADQVFTIPLKGGLPRQVTFHSEGSRGVDWYPDGKSIVIRGRRDFNSRSAYRFYRVSLEARTAEILLFDAEHSFGTASLSPNGKKLLFTREGRDLYRRGYRGSRSSQIWMAENLESDQVKFTEIISRETGASSPVWNEDGSGFYYTGDHGESDLFSLWSFDLESGEEKELAPQKTDPALLPTVSRDGSTIAYRSGFEFFRLFPKTEGKTARPRKISLFPSGDLTIDPILRRTLTKATNLSFSRDGLEMAFAAGGDIWIMDTELKEPVPITKTAAEEREPVMSPDGKSVLFIRDDGQTTDIWSAQRAEAESYWWQNREFKESEITNDGKAKHDLTFVPGGERICYHVGRGDLWTSDADGKNAKLLIESWSSMQYDWSPDGKWIAYAKSDSDFNRDIWIASADGKPEPYNLSRHPDSDSNPKWSPNGKILAFTGRRFEKETDIYYVYLSRSDEEEDSRDRALKDALTKMSKERKKATPPKPRAPSSEPKKVNPVPKGTPADPEQAPPSAPKTKAPEPNSATTKEPVPEKQGATQKNELDEKTASDSENKKEEKPPAKPEPKLPEVKIDFEGIYERIRRISIPDSTDKNIFWSHDSKRLAFGAKIKNNDATYYVTFPDKLTTPATLSSKRGSLAQWIARDDTILWLVDGVPSSLSKGTSKSYSFRARQELDRVEYRRTAFRQIWRTMGRIWYDPKLNNLDWEKIGEKYAPIAAEAADNQVFDRVVGMMLGELNGSHLGFTASSNAFGETPWKPAGGWTPTTAHLGVTWDTFFDGPGLKIEKVVSMGPADQEGSRLQPGEIILEIDGTKVDRKTDLTTLLNGPLEREIRLSVQTLPPNKSEKGEPEPENEKQENREVSLRPVTYTTIRNLMKSDLIRQNREMVEKLGEGKIGYVCVPRMQWNEFIKFEEEIYAEGAGKDGLIIDVRNNGGGFTADHLLTVLTPPDHAFTVPRGGSAGYPQDRRVYATWSKPITVLCNQNSFSNAEIFSHAVKHLDRGKLVGVTTSGGVISTGSSQIMDVGTLRIPFRGWFRLSDGADMEMNGAKPDFLVWNEPGELPKGKDRQIEKAVEVLKTEISAFQKRKRPDPKRVSDR